MLIEAFHRSGLAQRKVKLLLIGDGPAMPNLRAIVDQHGMGGAVVFTGPVPHDAVPEHLAQIDIAVQPAANEYCCPMKILEYMALGKPIIAPRQENIQELLVEGDEAEYFKPNDTDSLAGAMCRLVESPERLANMGRCAREAVKKRGYLWTANAERVLELAKCGEDGSMTAHASRVHSKS
jgi:glycosyltransferase involved in cell wall biosynthesis